MTMRWYIVHVYSGQEKSIHAALIERIKRSGMADKFGDVLVPIEEVVEMKKGAKATSERRFYPGYIMVQMEMTDETWHLIKSTPKITGFLGGVGNKPSPVPQKEIDSVLSRVKEGVEKPRPKILFEVGEMVRVKDGPFTDFSGSVEEVNYDKSKIRVSVLIFGRPTPVELDFGQVEKQ
jgi:transcription termination/antitermination protein NusG